MDGDRVVKGFVFNSTIVDNRPLTETITHHFEKPFIFGPYDKEDTLLNNIEVLLVKEHTISIQGWAITPDHQPGGTDSVMVILRSEDGKLFSSPTIADQRLDVSTYLRNNTLDSAGFHATIGTDSVKIGYYELGLFIHGRNNHIGRFRFVRRIAVGFPEQFTVTQFKDSITEVEMEFNLDKLQTFSQTFDISGWAADTTQISRDCEISILLRSEDNQLYVSKTKWVPRPDVTEYFEHKWNLDNSGFDAVISKKGLLRGKYQIGILLQCEGLKPARVKFSAEMVVK